MRILAIETSCDETAAAIVENGTKILSSVIATSVDMHAKTGGIIPESAARQQVKYIIPVIQKALGHAFQKDNIYDSPPIDAVAVTYGPGLIGSLLVGVEAAKTLSYLWNKPLIPVNHLIAHIYANFVDTTKSVNFNLPSTAYQPPSFPAVGLVVSGGHTDFVLMKSHSSNSEQAPSIKWLGGTRDDAAGECFDKCARLLGLPYPGGPSMSNSAQRYFDSLPTAHRPTLNLFPRPMINTKDFDLSFSGLKTSVYNYMQSEHKNISRDQLAAEIQEAIVDVLVQKSLRVIERYKPKSFLLSGGVAANKRLRDKLTREIENCKLEIALHIPHPSLCTDNAVAIASCAFFDQKTTPWQELSANPELAIAD